MRVLASCTIPQGLHGIRLVLEDHVIHADGRRQRSTWLLLHGHGATAAELAEAARPWVERHGHWLDLEAHAGWQAPLSPPARDARAVRAGTPSLAPDSRVDEAWQRVLSDCLQLALRHARVLCNPSDRRGGGTGLAEPLHQCRVALRRLRSLSRLFKPLGSGLPQACEAPLNELFRSLGATRECDVLIETLAPLWNEVGCPPLSWPEQGGHRRPQTILRAPSTTQLWLSLWAEAHRAPRRGGGRLKAKALPELQAQARRLRRELEAFDTLDLDARHRLRKRIKRHRYAIDACRKLGTAREVAAYLRSLSTAQDAMGRALDLQLALSGLQARAEPEEARAVLARGWLLAQARHAQDAAAEAARDLLRCARPWR